MEKRNDMSSSPADIGRRTLLAAPALASLARAAARPLAGADDRWKTAQEIAQRMAPPQFPARDFEVTRYGAHGNGERDNTEALAAAIRACHEAGGGAPSCPKACG